MPVFLVHGRDRGGEEFRRRFEAPSESSLTLYLSARSLHVTSVRALPLSTWPFSRVPFVMMLFPLFAWGVISFGGAAVRGGLTLQREQANQQVYSTLSREGIAVEGRVTRRGEQAQRRGKPTPIIEYQYRDPAGWVHRGELIAQPGDARRGRHELFLLPNTDLAEGDILPVTIHPTTPLLHAPFSLDEEFHERYRALLQARRQAMLMSLVGLGVCGWLVWNVALRLGSQYQHSSDPRIIELTSGRSILGEDEPGTPPNAAPEG